MQPLRMGIHCYSTNLGRGSYWHPVASSCSIFLLLMISIHGLLRTWLLDPPLLLSVGGVSTGLVLGVMPGTTPWKATKEP
jgi:hypothetical protein